MITLLISNKVIQGDPNQNLGLQISITLKPKAQTCFFQLRLPPYTSKVAMAKKMLYAIKHCRCIDMDNYMLARNANVLN